MNDKIDTKSVYEYKLAKFYEEICKACDNEFCTGVYDEHGRDVCELYNEEFNN